MSELRKKRQALRQQRLQHQLEVQSNQIERVFSNHLVTARVQGGTVERRSIHFDISSPITAGLEKLQVIAGELVSALGVPEVRLDRDNGRLRLQVVRPLASSVPLLELLTLVTKLRPVTAVLGLAEDGSPVLMNVTSPSATPILLSGESGAGKTTLFRSIAVSLALSSKQSQLQLCIIAPNGQKAPSNPVGIEPLEYLPHMLTPVVRSVEDAAELLDFLATEADFRIQNNLFQPRIALLLDDVTDLIEDGGSLILEPLTKLMQEGGEAGMSLILSAGVHNMDYLDAMLRADISLHVIGRCGDARVTRLLTGLPGLRADALFGRGDFLAVAEGMVTHFQGAHLSNYDLHLILQQMLKMNAPTLLALPVETQQAYEFNRVGSGRALIEGEPEAVYFASD